MARQTPSERRAKRDAYAQSLTDPRTGQPFRNYNALDTYQRNLKAKSRGFSSRGQERHQKAGKAVTEAQDRFPGSWRRFLGDQKPTEKLAKDFLKAFGPYPRTVTNRYRDESEALRAAYVAGMSEQDYDWNWSLWRDEYSAL